MTYKYGLQLVVDLNACFDHDELKWRMHKKTNDMNYILTNTFNSARKKN